jgi:RNA polymerase sigma-70 factor (ECF subfamily)
MTTMKGKKAAMVDTETAVDGGFKRELLAVLPSLRAFAMSLVQRHDRADDLVQDTIMKAWAKQESFELGTNMKAWLFTILRNEFYSQMRKKGREVRDVDGFLTERMAVHPAQYGSLDMKDFKKALDKLPDDQREAIILVGASGFAYEEAAEICGCAVGTIKSRVSRARASLRELLDVVGESEYGPDSKSATVTLRAFAK